LDICGNYVRLPLLPPSKQLVDTIKELV